MDADAYLKLLEDKFLTYKELSLVAVEDNDESMVDIGTETSVRVFSIDERMKKYTGNAIFVRESLVPRIRAAQEVLSAVMPHCALEVVYGYRHPSIQLEIYEEIRGQLVSEKNYTDEDELKEQVHHFIAVPEVAGHPTGGAVDVRIIDAGGIPLEMGTNIQDFVKNSYVHAPFISKNAWHNRQFLRQCMLTAGFAPYDGEWWHFSYGDREWARYYGKTSAVYDQIIFQSV